MSEFISVVVYSRGGQSTKLAARVADALQADVAHITTSRYRVPLLWYVSAVRDSVRGFAPPLLSAPTFDDDDGLIVVVGPVWAGRPAAPLLSLFDALSIGNAKVALALTCADPKESPAPLDIAQDRLGRDLAARMVLSNRHRDTQRGSDAIGAFVAACRAALAPVSE